MEQSRKHLKISSIVVLILAGVTLLNLVSELLFGEINRAEIPVGAPDNILLITKIILLVVSVVLLLPQIYIGMKGIKVAKKPDSSKGHIILGTVLLVIATLALVSPAIAIFNREDVFNNVSELLSIAVEVIVFFDYVKYARAVAKGI